MQEEISLIDLFKIIKTYLIFIALMTILGGAVAFITTNTLMTPKYSSNTQLLVNHSQSENNIQQSEINANIQLINTYEDIITNPIILEEVRDNLTLSSSINSLRDMITVQTDQNSQVFSIRVENQNPYLAASIANETAEVFSDNIVDIMNVDNVSIISEAVAADNPSSPNVVLNTIIGLIIGFLIALTISILKTILDTSVKDEEFIIEEIGWPSLGRVSMIDKKDIKKSKNNSNQDTVLSRQSRK